MPRLQYFAAVGLMLASLFTPAGANATQPRLVLQITVDGMRADLIDRYRSHFGEGGFNYLLANGAVFRNARYLHANTETIVGHTTLATGATPAVHGMIGNVWYQADTDTLGYNIEDPDAPLLPTRAEHADGAQVDPAQLRATTSGRSPRGILAPTLADTMAISQAGKAKIFGISSKDRSAVAMAGKSGVAYWFSTDNGDFLTSAYYMTAYPDWVQDWNAARPAEALGNTEWQLSRTREQYLFGARDDRPFEVDLKGFGRTFPHAFGDPGHPMFFTRVLVSAEGDRLLADFGKRLIDAEGIGQDAVTDYLSISFSGVDAVNHFFGPSSLENEETVVRLDRTLADLLGFIDEQVGLANTLIVLSADHGMQEAPEQAAKRGYPAGRLFTADILAEAKSQSEMLFGEPALVKDFFRPYLYLDRKALERAKLDRETVIQALSAAMRNMDGIRAAVPSGQAASLGESAVAHNHHHSRSGDIYVYQEPHWFLMDPGMAAMHGSPWGYDQHVPLIFAGPGVEPGRHEDLVHPVDVAPTLAALLGLPRPAAAIGEALTSYLSAETTQ
jgi:predicted AlkP superfamily pyrophosphatase or phosphodiesterase